MANSPLRWAGSKRSLMSNIRAAWPTEVDHYFEPFMGSACVFFDAGPTSASLSDFNYELVQFFHELQSNVEALATAFAELDPLGGDFYNVRAQRGEALTPADRAARFLYLNRFAFNGVYRTNRAGQFNVPQGKRTGALPSSSELLEASRQLSGTSIRCLDWREALEPATAGDFIYLDPPYRNDTRPTFGEYGYGAFGSAKDVQLLAAELKRLDSLGARVLLSFNDDHELGDTLEGWHIERIERRRSVAGKSGSRTTLRGEILARNYRQEAKVA
ncbi:DNA adenine methylase [Microbacterium sp. NPDC090014]|uniref:DNA adenine methylase n=1 Tax=Microbacterium sp. NPDC090014 TaxID=3364205 RepID=UPI0037F95A59